MQSKAFVLIETEMGKAKEINRLLRSFEEIMSTDLVTNPYDIIAIIGGRTEREIEDFASRKLRSIDGITRTVLCEAVPQARQGGPRSPLVL
jgi:DNA-binding Lrp family transcriptional regulator